MSLTALHLRAARARIAAACALPHVEPRLGSLRLRRDQCLSAARVTAALARDGGCVLADDVGRGKTYVALAVARSWARPLVVAPAALRSTWADAMRRAEVPCAFVSHDALSRGRIFTTPPDGIIVDESHHFRSTSARRYSALATLSARAPLLLLSATPLQNRTRDLAAQVALFHGGRACRLGAHALATFVVRSAAGDGDGLPDAAPPAWVRPVADDGAVLAAILALPPPARPADGGDAGALRTIGLVRAWASSRAALGHTLRRRRRVAAAIEQSAAEGLIPTRRELRAWQGVDSSIQLGFAPLLVHGATDGTVATALLSAVSAERDALARLSAALIACDDPDLARADALREIRAAHPGERVLAFTELASTARAYYAMLRGDAGVGLLTARDARIASGQLPRDALLARFAPRSRGAARPADRERVTLLIATDLLSEGMNLQDASVVVHLDLPWNPARLAQRVGRVRRPGGAAKVHAYLIASPARAELLLDVEQTLRRKLANAESAIGRGIDVVPRLAAAADQASVTGDGRAALLGELAERIACWARPAVAGRAHRRPIVAAAESVCIGWLAALDGGRVVGALDGQPPDDGDSAARAARLCEHPGRPLRLGEAEGRLAECQRWLDAERIARECGCVATPLELDAVIGRRIALALGRAPRHERWAIARLGGRLRESLRGPRPLGVERALRAILDDTDPAGDLAWLAKAVALACACGTTPSTGVDAPQIVALVALGPGGENG